MIIESYNSKSFILEVLDRYHNNTQSNSSSGVILTALYSNGLTEKKFIPSSDIAELGSRFSEDLVIEICRILDSGKSTGYVTTRRELSSNTKYIIELIQPVNSLIILGAGHVGRSLSLIASILGFEVTLIDDRQEFLNDNDILNDRVKKAFLPFDNYTESVSITSNCAIVIVTRGHQFDEICLKSAICTDAKYIGMIGSRRRVLAIMKSLEISNLSEKQLLKLKSVFAPIGLNIRARSPQEIAVSILAQIIQVMNSDKL
jgi:xanthine/CO dehydrogenase XdhC/CoxF family maturation factor